MNEPTLIERHSTRGAWAIGILRQTDRTGTEVWSVIRINPKNQYITISHHGNEPAAREAANTEWKGDTAWKRRNSGV